MTVQRGWCPQCAVKFKLPLSAAWIYLFLVKWHHSTWPGFQTCPSSFSFQLCLVRDIFTGSNRRKCPGHNVQRLKSYVYFHVAAHMPHRIKTHMKSKWSQDESFPCTLWQLLIFEVEISQSWISSVVSVQRRSYCFRIDSWLKIPVWESCCWQTP